eukprot:186145-Pyramimonas_sp.AAC.1
MNRIERSAIAFSSHQKLSHCLLVAHVGHIARSVDGEPIVLPQVLALGIPPGERPRLGERRRP